jgi:hypothetical protein
MNLYLRRFIAMRSTTPRDRMRARMLSLRSTEQQVAADIKQAWIALMQVHEAVARCKVLQQEVAVLRSEVAELTQEVADMRAVREEQVGARLNRLERFMLRSSVRGEGWWRKDPRIETFLRGAVVQLRQEGFTDTQILMDVLIGLSPGDLALLRAA